MKCYEKRRYPLIELANKAVMAMKNLGYGERYVYKCKECGGYHMTSMHPKEYREIKRFLK